MITKRVDTSERKEWYGDGEQPWDAIVRAGWGPEFAAGNIVKYLRRTKDREHSLQSAQWYWQRLHELADYQCVLIDLYRYLTPFEILALACKDVTEIKDVLT